MKARKKGTDKWEEVKSVSFKDRWISVNISDLEFEQEMTNKSPVKLLEYAHLQEVRERAAIAAIQGILSSPVIDSVNPNPSKKEIVEYSLALADELIKQLKTKTL